MIFTRKSDAALASLVKQLDKVLADNSNQKIAAFVNFIGPDRESLEADIKKFGTKHSIENVALVLPEDNENGPAKLKIDKDAEVTVMIYRGLSVKANHAVASGGLKNKVIREIVADTAKILD